MQRLGAIFIAICMVAISTSVGVMLHLRFNLSIPEAAPFSFGIFLTLLLVHYQISRIRDRMMIEEQMDDLTRLKLTLTKEVQDVRELAQRLEGDIEERMKQDVEPILAELDIIGSLVKQLAESCAELDERVQEGDVKVEQINATLQAAKRSVQELETMLRSNARSIPTLTEPSSYPSNDLADDPQRPSQHRANPEPMPPPLDIEAQHRAEEAAIRPEDEKEVRRALALGRIEMFMQPIVTLPMRKPHYYEALARLKGEEDQLLTPDVFLPICRKYGFLPMLDRLAINEVFRMQRRLADRGHIVDCFCNLALASLADSDFFAQLRNLFEQNRDLAEHVILEFSLADMRNFGVLEDETLQLLRSMGFRFSVDQMTALNADFDQFARKGVRFAKIAAPILTHREAGRGLDIHPADFSRVLSRKGIDLVVTHIESESALVGLIDYNIQLAQGDHFAAAKAIRGAGNGGEGGGVSSQGARSNQANEPISRSQSGQARARPMQSPHAQSGAGRPDGNQAARLHAQRQSDMRGQPNGTNAMPGAGPERRQETAQEEGQRRLGDNPRVAQALRAMAQREGAVAGSTRDHFRNVLAEAAGLMDEGSSPVSIAPNNGFDPNPGIGRANPAKSAGQQRAIDHDRLPATEDYGLKTSTDRGQYLDLSNDPPNMNRRRNPEQQPAMDNDAVSSGFERLIR